MITIPIINSEFSFWPLVSCVLHTKHSERSHSSKHSQWPISAIWKMFWNFCAQQFDILFICSPRWKAAEFMRKTFRVCVFCSLPIDVYFLLPLEHPFLCVGKQFQIRMYNGMIDKWMTWIVLDKKKSEEKKEQQTNKLWYEDFALNRK